MNLPLSPRLRCCCDFVHPGDRVADIGCDHGYLSIYLLINQIASSVIASDINEQPLQSAVVNAERFGVRDKVRFYLSDGVRNIPREFDTLVCAGMGGDTMVSILSAAPWLENAGYRLILQCQSKTPMLRKYLSHRGWHITTERVLRDGRFLYTIMEVVYDPDAPRLTPAQHHFPPAMLADPTAETGEYFRRLLFSLKRANDGRGANADPEMVAAYEALNSDPQLAFLKEESQ